MHPITCPALAGLALALSLTLAGAPALAQAQAATVAVDTSATRSAVPASTEAAYATAFAAFNRALAGDDAALDAAAAQFQALLTADATQPAFRAYLGSAIAMKARTTMLPWKKMGYADDGLAQIDKALAQLTPAHDLQTLGGVPASALVRYSAASTFLALPAMFNRADRGTRLMDELRKSPALAASPAAFQAEVQARAKAQ
jgi:hypothetical protein